MTAGTTYYLMVSSPGCCANIFTLNVTVPNPPANDLIENATPITALPFSATQDSLDARVARPTRPLRASKVRFRPSGTRSLRAPTRYWKRRISGGFSTYLTFYQGSPESLTHVTCTSGGRPVTVPVTKGATYYVAVVALLADTYTIDVKELLTALTSA